MSTMPLSVEDEVDLWKMRRFTSLGFDGGEIAALLHWRVSPHDVEPLLWRDGQRTSCTHEQALRIARPLEAVVLAKRTDCVVCDGFGCEHCPKV